MEDHMAIKTLPSRALLHQLLRYDAETGDLIWLPRTAESLVQNRHRDGWNSRYAGTVAGHIKPFPDRPGYLHIAVQGTIYRAHRLVWVYVRGEPVPDIIDHIDHDQLNNRIENLRAATASQNRGNSFMRRSSTSGIKGVSISRYGRFVVHIRQEGRDRHVGSFATKDEAIRAYEAAASGVYGEFARVHHR
jgi:hypothetical protein